MSKHKLLLADDSITIQKVVNLTFADEGIEVISVGDGNAAVEKLAEFTPDLVMADINMPGLSGYEICERIRANETTRNIPVILLVGSFEPFDEAEAQRVGANDFLTKPFQSIRQLVTKVSSLLESADKSSTDEIISDLETPKTPGEFENTLEMEKPESPAEEFGDSGMDDEMIQTAQVGTDEAQDAPIEDDDPRITQPLTTAEFDAIHQNQAEEERGYAFAGESPFAVPTAEELPSDTQSASFAETEPLPQGDSFYQTQEVMSKPSLETEDEANLLELPPRESLSAAALSSPVWQEEIAPPEEISETVLSDETAQSESSFELRETIAEEPQPAEEIEEIQAETETISDETAVEETSDEAAEDIDIREVPTDEMIDVSSVESAETTTETVAETTGETIPQLSPEVIEAIAAKVSERFSDSVIREIVEEIKPQITELIAKRIAE